MLIFLVSLSVTEHRARLPSDYLALLPFASLLYGWWGGGGNLARFMRDDKG
jgi:hypothetical protein